MGIIKYNRELNVLVSVKGHPFERDAFFEALDAFEDMSHTAVEQPASQLFLNPNMAQQWDALCF